jgi:hypothetical protein
MSINMTCCRVSDINILHFQNQFWPPQVKTCLVAISRSGAPTSKKQTNNGRLLWNYFFQSCSNKCHCFLLHMVLLSSYQLAISSEFGSKYSSNTNNARWVHYKCKNNFLSKWETTLAKNCHSPFWYVLADLLRRFPLPDTKFRGEKRKQDWKSFQSLPASIILVYCIGSNLG